jgi:ubiquinone/menaquinone biosynthesis C-methylase UbiE
MMNRTITSENTVTMNEREGGTPEHRPEPLLEKQKPVDEYFDTASPYWDAIYASTDLQSTIYKDRQALALKLLDDLKLPKHARILEAGSGAGVLTMSMAQRGYHVSAFDSSPAMKELTEQRAKKAGLNDLISVSLEDVHNLNFKEQSFDAVVALGVLPWLHSPQKAIGEITRVLKPGGYMIVTVDNKLRLNQLFDPRLSPVFNPLRRMMKSLLEMLKVRKPSAGPWIARMHSPNELDAMLVTAGVEKLSGVTLGFGPFMFMGKRFIPDSPGKKINRFFQSLADRNVAGIRSTGSHYIIVGQRPLK